jgi:CRP-like cAMP-binding protein
MSSLQQRSIAQVARFPIHPAVALKAPALAKAALAKAAASAASEHEEALKVLDSIGTPLQFKRNETIFSEGDESHHVYRVARGATRSCRILMDGRRQIAGFGLPGDFLGLEWQPLHSQTAEAVSDVTLISYPRSQIERLGDVHPALRHEIMQLLVDGLSDSQARLVMLGRQTAIERLAWFLVRKRDRLAGRDGVLDLPMSRLDIADYLGLTIETVSRTLSKLKAEGLIALPMPTRLEIRDRDRLEDMAAGEGAVEL